MLTLKPTNRFLKDVKRAQKRGKDLGKLEQIINQIQVKNPLPPKNRDHHLSGSWQDHRECHLEPDWLLIYRIDGEFLFLERTDTHADLF